MGLGFYPTFALPDKATWKCRFAVIHLQHVYSKSRRVITSPILLILQQAQGSWIFE
jgi:hypothetical protein